MEPKKVFCKVPGCGKQKYPENSSGYCVRHEDHEARQLIKADNEKKRRQENMENRKKRYDREHLHHVAFMEHEAKRLKEMSKPLTDDYWKDYAKTTFGIDLDNLESEEAKSMLKFVNPNTAVKITPTSEQVELMLLKEKLAAEKSHVAQLEKENVALRTSPFYGVTIKPRWEVTTTAPSSPPSGPVLSTSTPADNVAPPDNAEQLSR